MTSALYEGTLRHRRGGPGPANDFSYRVAMPLIDLDGVEAVTSAHPLWSSRLPAPVWFRRADFLGPPARPLAEAVRDLVGERSGTRPEGKVALLANLRTWGWLFNPISLYFCFSADGQAVDRLVAEAACGLASGLRCPPAWAMEHKPASVPLLGDRLERVN